MPVIKEIKKGEVQKERGGLRSIVVEKTEIVNIRKGGVVSRVIKKETIVGGSNREVVIRLGNLIDWG